MFRPGQSIVCIDDAPASPPVIRYVIRDLERHRTYTVRAVTDGGRGVRLEEVRNAVVAWGDGTHEGSYRADRFCSEEAFRAVRAIIDRAQKSRTVLPGAG